MGYSSDVRQKLEEERKKLKDKLEAIEAKDIKKVYKGEALKNVKEGDEVLLASINQKVIVLSKPDNKGDVLVQAGIMKITANIKDLRAVSGSNPNSNLPKVKKSKKINLNLRRVESSVDLRGMDSEEAIYTVDKYLDEAYLGGLGEVTIVHGKGTGVLRKAIMNMLKGHPHVKRHRLGEYGEGGTGVTIVELK